MAGTIIEKLELM